RLFPHTFSGEGHFACLLKKNEDSPRFTLRPFDPFSPLKTEKKDVYGLLGEFGIDAATLNLKRYGDTVYIVSDNFSVPQGVRIVRGGLPVVKITGKRVEPLHGVATFLKKGQCKKTIDFPCESEEIIKYVKGEPLGISAPFKGYGVIAADGYPLGLVKSSDGVIKNRYPKGLRR
ncbi:MAG: hypothetical protein J6Z34_01450, partial [Clostridia bacterium]|nr:hypothetical protein [Clostridia bacterium]